jgi:phosphatidate cytidylyltransferase
VLSALIAGAVFVEWTMMTSNGRDVVHAAVSGAGLAALLAGMAWGMEPWLALAVLAAAIVLSALSAAAFRAGAWFTWGVVYAGLFGIALASVRGDTAWGLVAILYLFAVVWITDIAAYFVGRRLGGPKLAPSISPGKTWSGAIGDALGAMAAGAAVVVAAGLETVWYFAVLALGLSIVSQAGDLFESAVKRRFGAKDSSHLIPGHGGVMDRVDGLAAAAVALYVIAAAASGLTDPAARLFAG